MQQVLCCELTKAEDAQEVEVGQVAGVLPVQITESDNADYPFQSVQVCVPNLRWRSVSVEGGSVEVLVWNVVWNVLCAWLKAVSQRCNEGLCFTAGLCKVNRHCVAGNRAI